MISIESAALWQLVRTTHGLEDAPPPSALVRLQKGWSHGTCFFALSAGTGWRGVFAEHRPWTAILELYDPARVKNTACCKPTIRSWFPAAIVEDMVACAGLDLLMRVAHTVAELGFDGAPDLMLYRRSPPSIWLVEVKSSSDSVRDNQRRMIKRLSAIPGVSCSICCPQNAVKRMASAMAHVAHDGEESASSPSTP